MCRHFLCVFGLAHEVLLQDTGPRGGERPANYQDRLQIFVTVSKRRKLQEDEDEDTTEVQQVQTKSPESIDAPEIGAEVESAGDSSAGSVTSENNERLFEPYYMEKHDGVSFHHGDSKGI